VRVKVGVKYRHFSIGIATALVLGLTCHSAVAEKRVALVIGNSNYRNVARLPNPERDAASMAKLFKDAGFDTVVVSNNVGNLEFKRALRKFEDAATDSDIAVVYYAGHGLEVGGINYLVPVDAKLASDRDVEDEAVGLSRLLESVDAARRFRLIILDACRDNPFTVTMKRLRHTASRAITPGLAKVEPARPDTLIAYAAKAGSTAEDGDDIHSPFATALLDNLVVPGLDIRLVLGRVRDEVIKITGGRQEPFVYGSLGGAVISLVPTAAANHPRTSAPGESWKSQQANFEITFWNSIKDTKNPRLFEAYLKRYPTGTFADLARITLDSLKTAALVPPADVKADSEPITDAGMLKEVRQRLYELNFDPGSIDGPPTQETREAIREFELQTKLAPTGVATLGVLRRLREIGGLKPWGAIVYGKEAEKWGMSWGENTRKDAVARARSSCGKSCPVEVSFFGTECGAFAHSDSSWAIAARDDTKTAKEAALSDCGKRGKSCRVIASVCADGAEQFTSSAK
jgi:Caspase domain/Domain of unknown function (DUF4189)/Putative peptidoglycan binding domain